MMHRIRRYALLPLLILVGGSGWAASALAQGGPPPMTTTTPFTTPVYVIDRASELTPDFIQKAIEAIQKCCAGQTRALPDCPPEQKCEHIQILINAMKVTVAINEDHFRKDRFLAESGDGNYSSSNPTDREKYLLNVLKTIVRCDDLRHHRGEAGADEFCKECAVPVDKSCNCEVDPNETVIQPIDKPAVKPRSRTNPGRR